MPTQRPPQKPIPYKPRVGLERPIRAEDAPADSDPLGLDNQPARPRHAMEEVDVPDPPAGAGSQVSGVRSETPAPGPRPPAPDTQEDVAFTRGPARRPAPTDPLLQWATGLPTTRKAIYAGWLIQSYQSEALDEALLAAGFDCVSIRHGAGNVVEHWALPSASLFVICEGVQSIGEMKQTAERYGIAFGWRGAGGQGSGVGSRPQSVLRCRVLIRELLQAGYTEPLLLSLKSTLTGDFLAALMRQYDVLDALANFRAEAKKPPMPLPFYACSIPLGPGEAVARGSVQTKEITPMAALVPTPITREYVLAHWIKREWVPIIEGLLDQTVAWSTTTSQLIAAGEANGSPEGTDLL